MSALPPKADMCIATDNVCFGPEADIVGSGLIHLRYRRWRPLSALDDVFRHVSAECQREWLALGGRQPVWFRPTRDRVWADGEFQRPISLFLKRRIIVEIEPIQRI